MRTLHRLGVTAATVAVGASVALAGAGVASAAIKTTSPHSVSVTGTTATVKNGGDKALECAGYLTTDKFANLIYKQVVKGEAYEPSISDMLAYVEATQTGKFVPVVGNVPANKSAAMENVMPAAPGLSAIVACSDGTDEYILRSNGGGFLGSADMGGSLGGLTGSLGS